MRAARLTRPPAECLTRTAPVGIGLPPARPDRGRGRRRPGPPDVVLAGHGSRDPAASAVLERLHHAVAARLAPLSVALAWIEFGVPLLSDVLGAPGASPDRGAPVVIPLLLSHGTHLTRDLPENAAPPLGPDPVLTGILLDRVRQAGIESGRPLVLAAAGSTDPRGTLDVSAQAQMLQAAWGAPVRAGFVTREPSLAGAAAEATAALPPHSRSPALSRPAVVSYFLAPGRLPRCARPDTDHLGSHPGLVELVLMRYRAAAPDGVTRLGL